MHCAICDRNLKDHELVRRHGITNEFLDLCDACVRDIPGLPTKMPREMPTSADPFEHTQGQADDIMDCHIRDTSGIDKDW